MGPVSKEKLSKLYHEALGLVVPSRAEGFCLPALEAHACGTPVISTPIPAVREILGDADVICPGFAPADIAQGIMRFLESPTVRREISQHDSYRWVEQYSRHVLARRVLSVYGEAVQAKS
jgi:glycosyltransferase involved in cell wall biosynthesis